MSTLSWRRAGSSSAFALLLVVGLPALAQAQLFPNLFVRRERVPCANEDPFYGHVRRDFYGYYPTCWKKFPEGWGCPCPNPEAPNAEAEFRRQPRDERDLLPSAEDLMRETDRQRAKDDAVDPFLTPDPGTSPRRSAPDPTLPPVPADNTSPFKLDESPKRPAVPAGPVDDPFLTPDPTAPGRPAAAPAAPGARPAPGPLAPSTGSDPLNLERPKSASRRSTPGESSDPVLALPEMTPPSSSLPASNGFASMPPSLPTNGSFVESGLPVEMTRNDPKAEPAQAPRRPSLIGSLFNQGGRRRR